MATTAFAITITPFTGWDDVINNSSDIFIAACTSANSLAKAESRSSPKIAAVVDGVARQQVEIVDVLKGNAKLGESHVLMPCTELPCEWPREGDFFIVFAHGFSDNPTNTYLAIEDYRTIPITTTDIAAWTNALAGKTLKEQVKMILEYRAARVNYNIQKDQAEKKRLEDELKDLKK
jgi:hypothetical protein